MNQKEFKIELTSCVFKTITAEFSSNLENVILSLDSKQKYPIQAAFSVRYINNEMAIYLSLWINKKGKIPGYIMHTQTFNYFERVNSADSETILEEKETYEIEALALAFEKVREKILILTTPFPIGSYELPEINIKDLYKANRWYPDNPLANNNQTKNAKPQLNVAWQNNTAKRKFDLILKL